MPKQTDDRVVDASLYFLPVYTRVPLKFGMETVSYVTCVRVPATVKDRLGTPGGWLGRDAAQRAVVEAECVVG